MRAVVQRVSEARVEVNQETIGAIDKGLLVLIGIESSDNEQAYSYMIDKIINLRIFEDENDKMNLSLKDINGGLLIVPNFTLYGDCRKGRRPSYIAAAKPNEAEIKFKDFCKFAKESYSKVETGQFQADMKVHILNDGPVTLLIDSNKQF